MAKITAIKVEATQHTAMYQPPMGSPCWHTIEDASKATGVSESALRRAIKRGTAVQRINGGAVAGMVEIAANGRTGYLPYAR